MNNHSKKVLIASEHFDFHASGIKWGLEQMGVPSDYWCINDFTSKQTISVFPSRSQSLSVNALNFEMQHVDYRSVWLRRGLNPIISDEISSLDAEYALREARILVAGVLAHFSETSFVVNDADARQKYNNKVRQLFLAEKIGLRIPDTIISNSPREIIKFYNENNGKIIFKPLSFANWIGSKTFAGAFTTRVNIEDLKNESALQACPGIFQSEIDKKYELRVTVMGQSVFPVKLITQEKNKSLDWRVDFRGNPPCVEYQLPESIETKILEYMHATGLVFGCFDFIVDTSGEYVFLEVNEMGQFLWLDFALPNLRLFDAFCNFLAEAKASFEYRPSKYALAVQDFNKYYQENKKMYDEISRQHLNKRKSLAIIETDEITSEMLR